MPNVYVLLVVFIVFGVTNFTSYRTGYRVAEGEATARNLEAANAAAKAIAAANDRVREAEKKTQDMVTATSAAYEVKLQGVNDAKNAALAAARRSGLYVRADCPASGANPVPQASEPASDGDGGTVSRLPDEVAQDLIGFAADADRNTEQLAACQQVIKDYLAGK